MYNMKTNNKGVTLLELIVSIAVLSIMTAPYLHSFFPATKRNVETQAGREANFAAQFFLEVFKSTPLEDLLLTYENAEVKDPDWVEDPEDGSLFFELTEDEHFPDGNKNRYTARVELTPVNYKEPEPDPMNMILNPDKPANAINDYRWPVLKDVKLMEDVFIMRELYMYDTEIRQVMCEGDMSKFERKHAEIEISKDAGGEYIVATKINYRFEGSGINGLTRICTSYPRDKIPEIYIYYTMLGNSSQNRITIKNNVPADDGVVRVHYITQNNIYADEMDKKNFTILNAANDPVTLLNTGYQLDNVNYDFNYDYEGVYVYGNMVLFARLGKSDAPPSSDPDSIIPGSLNAERDCLPIEKKDAVNMLYNITVTVTRDQFDGIVTKLRFDSSMER